MLMNDAVDVVILSNGPGELATWVRPVVKTLRQQLGNNRDQLRISVILSPCPNASGKEAHIAQAYPEVDRVQAASHFFSFLLTGKTQWLQSDTDPIAWRDRGVVLFLGGDQVYPIIVGRRLGYRIVVYAEWEARWHRWVDRFGVMNASAIGKSTPHYADKFTVVGDLMAEVATAIAPDDSNEEWIGLLPGSKPAKLMQGVPFALAIAQHFQIHRPQTRFVLPVAPTLDLATLAQFADRDRNPIIPLLGTPAGEIVNQGDRTYLKSETGALIELYTQFPAYEMLSQCRLCLTTVGANTAELGALAVPMIVLLPTHQLDAMRSWDGLPGLLANLPGVGTGFAKLINWLVLQRLGLRAWPNLWAKAEIVPELVGKIQPETVAHLALDYLNNPEKLQQMRDRLRQVRGEPGAAEKLVELIRQELALSR